eukprot:COSAG02_NODE_32173_length_521_cov_0.556872_1_plen_173_part_11
MNRLSAEAYLLQHGAMASQRSMIVRRLQASRLGVDVDALMPSSQVIELALAGDRTSQRYELGADFHPTLAHMIDFLRADSNSKLAQALRSNEATNFRRAFAKHYVQCVLSHADGRGSAPGVIGAGSSMKVRGVSLNDALSLTEAQVKEAHHTAPQEFARGRPAKEFARGAAAR